MLGKSDLDTGVDGKPVMLPSGNQTWLENPRTEWRFSEEVITYKWSIVQHAMFDYRMILFVVPLIVVWAGNAFGGVKVQAKLKDHAGGYYTISILVA